MHTATTPGTIPPPLRPLVDPEKSDAEHKGLGKAWVQVSKREALTAMRHLDASATRGAHYKVALAAELLQDALDELERS